MKNINKITLTASIALASLLPMTAENPLLKPFDATPHQTAPFNSIKTEHFEPAIMAALDEARAEIDAIAQNPEEPTFENTVVALERSQSSLNRVLGVFYPLASALSSPEIMDIENRISGPLSDFSSSIILNEPLWRRIKTVYDKRDSLSLDTEDRTLLDETYRQFAQAGATLQGDDRETFKRLNAELSDLTNRFGQNVLRELNATNLPLYSIDDMAGLPDDIVAAAAEDARAEGSDAPYLITMQFPSYSPFMKYSSRRDLRERLWTLYNTRNTQGKYSNMQTMADIAEKRRQLANLLGAPTYAAYVTQNRMAQSPQAIMNLLNQLTTAYRPALDAEMKELTEFASGLEGKPMTIMPWDYSYYSNKLKNHKYSFDEEAIKPYFPLQNVIDGVFGLATRLYGITFTPNDSIEVYHPDVKAFDVTDPDNNYVGVLYTDFFPRTSKRSGAWMTNFKEQWHEADGTDSRPHVSIVMNFTKPSADKPSLLTPYEVETFLHEFGHALHGLLSRCRYQSLSGTNVYRDFVELPSQFNENYLTEKEFVDTFARHYLTGQQLPQTLLSQMTEAERYGAAYACLRQLSFGLIDMGWHNDAEPITADNAAERENNAYAAVAIFPYIDGSLISPQFSHIFSGGYASGYYSYKWAEVLDADAFEAFRENGIFDHQTAQSFLHNILERGGTENPAILYKRFRGKDPSIDALLIRDGIKQPANQPN